MFEQDSALAHVLTSKVQFILLALHTP